jgi:hypothetical protein
MMLHQGNKVAVVEIGGSHDECLLSQFSALKQAKCHVTFIGTQDLWERNTFFHDLVDVFHPISFSKKAVADFKIMRNLNRFFVNENIEKVLLNTAQGAHIRNLCLTASSKVEFIGIVHTLNKFKGSFTQKLIHTKIKKYFVLNDYFLSKIIPPKGIRISSFYPLEFPHFDLTIQKSPSENWLAIIGGVENRRKDLVGCISLMKQLKGESVKFIFLGKSNFNSEEVKLFKEELAENELTDKVILFDKFVSSELFDAYLKQTDFIWPLVHPNTPSADEYFKNQISGAMNVSFAYKIPLLVHEVYFADWKDLHYSFSYSVESFAECFKKAQADKEKVKKALLETEKFTRHFQAEKYVDFIFTA